MSTTRVLFICMGNICRSPTAHGIFQQKVTEQGLNEKITVDSAGTHAYHMGEAPDRRSQATAVAQGSICLRMIETASDGLLQHIVQSQLK